MELKGVLEIKNVNKKGSSSIAVLLLVLFVLMLVIFILAKMYVATRGDAERIFSTDVLGSVYAREEQVNYFVQGVIDEMELQPGAANIPQSFVNRLRWRIDTKYKDASGKYVLPELEQVVKQLDVGRVEIKNNGELLEITLDIVLEDRLKVSGDEIFSVEYRYSKTFEKELR